MFVPRQEQALRILITAVKGYVGSALARQLSPDHAVVGVTRAECDLTNPNSVETFLTKFGEEPFDFLIHCAINGGSREKADDAEVTHSNLLMFNNLMQWKGRAFDSVINIGSGAEYDRRYPIRPESRATNRSVPIDPYGMSKFYINQYIRNIPDAYNLRIFAVFDENELNRRMIKTALTSYIAGEPVRLAGDGALEMDFIYMDDFVYLVKRVLDRSVPAGTKTFDCVYKSYGFPDEFATSKSIRHLVEFHIGGLEPGKSVQTVEAPELTVNFAGAYLGTPPEWVDESQLIGIKEGIRRTYEALKRSSR